MLYEARSQSANMCRQKPQKSGREGREGGGESKTTADWLALPRDAKVHQAVKCRKSKQAFNETKAPPPTSSCVWQQGVQRARAGCAPRWRVVWSAVVRMSWRKENTKSQLISRWSHDYCNINIATALASCGNSGKAFT